MIIAGLTKIEADLHYELSVCLAIIAGFFGSIALGIVVADMASAFLLIAIGFLFAMRAVRARRRADSLYARAAAAALAEGADPLAMPEAA